MQILQLQNYLEIEGKFRGNLILCRTLTVVKNGKSVHMFIAMTSNRIVNRINKLTFTQRINFLITSRENDCVINYAKLIYRIVSVWIY